VTSASKHLQTLALRRVAKSRVLSVVSERIIVKSKLRLIWSSDTLTKSLADRSSSDTPANRRDDPRSNKLCFNEYGCRCSIFVLCNKCARIHNTGISLMMQHGPNRKQSLADLYNGNVPEYLTDLFHTLITCPWTGKQFRQTDKQKIFLVPTNNSGCQAEKGLR
jgi:hypothetical protein